LPEEVIAQKPWIPRDECKLMVLRNKLYHRVFYEITDYLYEGDILVLNDTRVRHAHLSAHKDTGGKLELLVLGIEGDYYSCLVKGKVREGTIFTLRKRADIRGSIVAKKGGLCQVDIPLSEVQLEQLGELPFPPYIKGDIDKGTAELYQTTYSMNPGSVAAPTAGLHFTPGLLHTIKKMGVRLVTITLHVSIGTFMPIRGEHVEDHMMQSEWYHISDSAARAINKAACQDHQIIAVGTTTIKTLESATHNGIVEPGSGWSDLFIYPGYRMQSPLTGMLTNFHLPQSTPLLLTCAFAGKSDIMAAYKEAIRSNYRFLSFGDAMLILGVMHV